MRSTVGAFAPLRKERARASEHDANLARTAHPVSIVHWIAGTESIQRRSAGSNKGRSGQDTAWSNAKCVEGQAKFVLYVRAAWIEGERRRRDSRRLTGRFSGPATAPNRALDFLDSTASIPAGAASTDV